MPDAAATGHKSNLGFLTRKIGPAPVWVYGVIIVAAWYWYTRYGPGSKGTAPAAAVTTVIDKIAGPRGPRGPQGPPGKRGKPGEDKDKDPKKDHDADDWHSTPGPTPVKSLNQKPVAPRGTGINTEPVPATRWRTAS